MRGGLKTWMLVLSGCLGVFLVFWVALLGPLLLRMPANFSLETHIDSADRFFDVSRNTYQAPIYSKTTYGFQTIAANEDRLLLRHIFDVRTPADEPIFSVERFYGVNRFTGAHVPGMGDKDREGYLFAPRGLKKGEAFTYWHANYDAPAHMTFVNEEVIDGLRVYHYEADYGDVVVDQTENLGYLPEVGETRGIRLDPYLELWIEPVSGRLVSYADDTIAYYYDLASGEVLYPWNHFSNTINAQDVAKLAKQAAQVRDEIWVVGMYIPIIIALIAIWLLLHALGVGEKIRQRIPVRLRIVSVGSVVVVVGVLMLVGWGASVVPFYTLGSLDRPVNPLFALIIAILGGVIVIRSWYEHKERFTSMIGCAIFLVGCVELLGLYGILPFVVDEVLFPTRTGEALAHISILSTLALCYIGLSIGCFRFTKFKQLRVGELLSLIVALLSFLAVLSFFFPSLGVSDIRLFAHISLQEALCLLLVGVSLYILHRLQGSDRVVWRGHISVLFVCVLCVITTVICIWFFSRGIEHENEAEFSATTLDAIDLVQDRIELDENILRGGLGLIAASEQVERDEWHSYVQAIGIPDNYPGIQGLGYAIFIKPEDLAAHEAVIRESGIPTYTVWPEGPRDLYTSIMYLEPSNERNKRAIGFDMFQESVRRLAMEHARDTGLPIISGRITLVQETDTDVQPGFLMYIPVFRKGSSVATIEERRAAIVGYVYSPFRARNFFEDIFAGRSFENVSLRIFDGIQRVDAAELFDNDHRRQWGDQSAFTITHTIYVAGRPWTLVFEAAPTFSLSARDRFAPIILFNLGIGFSICIALIFYAIIQSRLRAVEAVKKTRSDLMRLQSNDDAILRSIGEGLVVTDVHGVVTLVNPELEAILGWKREEILGKKWIDLVLMRDMQDKMVLPEKRVLTRVLSKRSSIALHQEKAQYQTKTGAWIPVALTVSPVLDNGEFVGVVEVFRDLTRELEIDRAKTDFVLLASHQLRTPLTAIGWYVEDLLSDTSSRLTKTQKERLRVVWSSNQRMIGLIDALLNVSRLELGTFAFHPEPVDVKALMEEVLLAYKQVSTDNNLHVAVYIQKNLPSIEVDRGSLKLIAEQLIKNAFIYTLPDGRVELRVGYDEDTRVLHIEVIDSGIGIPANQQPYIFTRMFRADNANSVATDGNGFGLFIVKTIVDRLGGKIWFTSKINHGSSFFVDIPAVSVSSRAMKRKKSS